MDNQVTKIYNNEALIIKKTNNKRKNIHKHL